MNLDNKKQLEILQNSDYVSPEDAAQISSYLDSHSDISLLNHLVSKQLITKDLFGQAIAEHYKMRYVDLNSNRPTADDVLSIPEPLARKFRIVYFSSSKQEVVIATDSPEFKTDILKGVDPAEKGQKVIVAYGLTEDIDEAFLHYAEPLTLRIEKIVKNKEKVAPRVLEQLVSEAVSKKVSDIHFEPVEGNVLVRFRLDGLLREVANLSPDIYNAVTNHIKVQANLRIDEHFATQDGSLRFTDASKQTVDLRVSVIPTLNGEKLVLRLLAEYVRQLSFAELGFTAKSIELINEAVHKPFGMILTTGPTGSGKTTTVYSIVRQLQKPEVNITTIEDPVEYRIPGVNQIQVNPRKELTFARGLRSIVRQDPNIILVGEIRDTETAEVAVNAALTGHLLLSTFHANDAATAIPRLLDMEIEPFLLASTLNIIIAQRLVRRLCESCRVSETFSKADILKDYPGAKKYFTDSKYTLYNAKGCANCNSTGYKGRVGLYELISVTPEIRDLILTRPAMQDVWKLAKQQGSVSFFEDGLEKVKTGLTSLSELTRVAPVE